MKSLLVGSLTMTFMVLAVSPICGQSPWPPTRESVREGAVDWVRSANKFGYDHGIVNDMAQVMDEALEQDYNLNIFFGSDLMESGTYRSLHLFCNQVLSFELTPEQAAAMGLESSSVTTTSNGSMGKPADTISFELSDLEISNANSIGLRQKFSGQVRCTGVSGTASGEYALRVSYRGAGGGVSQFQYLDSVPDSSGQTINFEFGPVNDEESSETTTGPVPVIFDIVSVDQSGGDVQVFLHSRAIGTVITVVNE